MRNWPQQWAVLFCRFEITGITFCLCSCSDGVSVFGRVNYINPLDVWQYLYCLTPKPDVRKDPKVLKGITNIGKLDIVWKTSLGEKGRLQTSALQRVVSGEGRSMSGKLIEYVKIDLVYVEGKLSIKNRDVSITGDDYICTETEINY